MKIKKYHKKNHNLLVKGKKSIDKQYISGRWSALLPSYSLTCCWRPGGSRDWSIRAFLPSSLLCRLQPFTVKSRILRGGQVQSNNTNTIPPSPAVPMGTTKAASGPYAACQCLDQYSPALSCSYSKWLQLQKSSLNMWINGLNREFSEALNNTRVCV